MPEIHGFGRSFVLSAVPKVSCSSETQRFLQVKFGLQAHHTDQVLHIATKIGSFASAVLVYEWPMFHGGRISVAYSMPPGSASA